MSNTEGLLSYLESVAVFSDLSYFDYILHNNLYTTSDSKSSVRSLVIPYIKKVRIFKYKRDKVTVTVFKISGLPVTMQSFDEILQDMDNKISDHSYQHYISITNTESMYHALRMETHKSFILNADHSCCDGVGVVIAGIFWGKKVPRRNGPVLMLKACEYGLNRNWKHYFYGGKEGVADKLKTRLSGEYTGLNVVGTYCPPFGPLSEEEKRSIIEDIKESEPDIIWVGLGLVKQEAWIAEFLNEVNVPWMVGVGAAFDYHTGEVSWAPKWVQAIGMEWLYRTILQPKLRIKRYIWSFHFMFASIIDAIVTRSTQLFGLKTNGTK